MEPLATSEDQMLSLAFSLNSTPGSYAFLLGAGASAGSGVPSAWGVLQDLLAQLAAVKKANPKSDDERMSWFTDAYGEEPTYERILAHLAPTKNDRQAILRSYFEATPEEQERGLKQPTKAHDAIARLIAAGAANVVITLNFDNLMESALRSHSINPVVVRGQSDLDGLGPLHTIGALVVHLHGDYLAPAEMRNTELELGSYTPATEAFLDRIFRDYGLVLVGWSASHDPKLRESIRRSFRRIYVPFWVEPGVATVEATELGAHLETVGIHQTADDALSQLTDSYFALRDRAAARNPLTPALIVSTAKRELSGRYTAIRLHDHLKRESDRLHQDADLLQSYTGNESPNGGYVGMVSRLEEQSTVLAAAIAATAYWGSESTDHWWLDEIETFGSAPRAGGLVGVLNLHNLVMLRLFSAAGIAAVAAGRYEAVRALFAFEANDNRFGHGRAFKILDPVRLYEGAASAGARLFELHRPLFVDQLSIGDKTYQASWEKFEIVRNVAAATSEENSETILAEIAELRQGAELLQEVQGTNGEARRALDQALERYANLFPFRSTHLRMVMSNDVSRYESPVVGRLIREISGAGEDHALLQKKVLTGTPESIMDALSAMNVALQRSVSFRSGLFPQELWIDEP